MEMQYTTYLLAVLLICTSCQKEKDQTAVEDSLTLQRNNAEMPVYIYGNAASKVFVIVLHGGPGGNGLAYRNGVWEERLEDNYAMVYWDQRGGGMAQGNLDASNLNIAEMEKDLAALNKVIKFKYGEDISLFLFGHSWGCFYGSSAFINTSIQEEYVGWIFANGTYNWCTLIDDEVEAFLSIGSEQIQAGNNVAYWQEQVLIAQNYNNTNCNDFSINGEAHIAEQTLTESGVIEIVETTQTTLNSNFIQNNFVLTNLQGLLLNNFLFEDDDFTLLSLTDDLDKITLPTLVIAGLYDMVTPLQTAQTYFDAIGSAEKELFILEKSGHQSMFTEPQLLANEVISFIEKNR